MATKISSAGFLPNVAADNSSNYDRTPYGENAPGFMQGLGEARGNLYDPSYGIERWLYDAAQDLENQAIGIVQDHKNQFFGKDLTIGQALLGGSTGTSRSQSYIYDPQEQFLRGQYYPYLTNIFNRYADQPGSLIAGFDPYQRLGQRLGGQSALNQYGQVGQANQALSQALRPETAINSPFFQQSLQATLNPFIRNFQQNIIPGIRGQAVGVGQTGSSREGIAQGLATQGLTQQIGDIASQFGQNAFNQGINQRLSALGLAPQIGAYNYLPSQALQDIGGQRQALAQQYRQAPLIFGSQLRGLIGDPTILQEQQSRNVSQRGLTQGFQDVFGGQGGGSAGGAMSLFSSFSDRRLKRNIKCIGKAANLPLYLFEYLSGQWSIGFMSDEVKEVYPEAVTIHQGYDMVDYGAIL